MKVSLVTVTYNRADQLLKGLRTVLNQNLLPDEIILVDDGSTDHTKQVVASLQLLAEIKGISLRYIYLDHPEPRISCVPRNIGIKQATGDLIIFTESETLHVGNTIQQILEKLKDDPDQIPVATQVWSMGSKIWEKFSKDNPDAFTYPARILSHPYAMLVSGNMQNTNAPDSDWGITGSNNCFVGILFAAWKEDLIKIGGFDESFQGHGWDDWDLIHRLGLIGKPVLYCNDIVVIHQWHRKDYPYNIYESSEKNGKISEKNVKAGKFKVNDGDNWGIIEK